MKDYIEDAVPFESYRAPIGLYALQYQKLKDECYGKMIYLIKNRGISFADNIGEKTYVHANMKQTLTVMSEFVEECRVVTWADAPNGKKRLLTKKEMNKKLGRGRSMDLLDPVAMRMYPLLSIAEGYELETMRKFTREQEEETPDMIDIYDERNWY